MFNDANIDVPPEINSIQPKIKELRKYDNFCKEIRKRSESIQDTYPIKNYLNEDD